MQDAYLIRDAVRPELAAVAVASLGAINLGVGSAFAQSYSHAAPPPDNQVQTDR
ncbi:MAG: hypothetical protein QOF70_4653 [Acetobacteraceae bacterium]|jgi:hypothetical protein|nr:hypothetical protein [Rhodopila sp.]MEA2730178.1 hypothetical protein [Acetobacteraceae bacterium]